MINLVISVDLLILVNFRNSACNSGQSNVCEKEAYDSCEYGDSENIKISLILGVSWISEFCVSMNSGNFNEFSDAGE